MTDATGRVGTASASALHPGSGARASQSPQPWGKMGFSQPQRGKQGFGDQPGCTGKVDGDHNSGNCWGATPNSLGAEMAGSIRVLGAKPAFELKSPELPSKWPQGRRSWAWGKSPASASGFSSLGDESRDGGCGWGRSIHRYICVHT